MDSESAVDDEGPLGTKQHLVDVAKGFDITFGNATLGVVPLLSTTSRAKFVRRALIDARAGPLRENGAAAALIIADDAVIMLTKTGNKHEIEF